MWQIFWSAAHLGLSVFWLVNICLHFFNIFSLWIGHVHHSNWHWKVKKKLNLCECETSCPSLFPSFPVLFQLSKGKMAKENNNLMSKTDDIHRWVSFNDPPPSPLPSAVRWPSLRSWTASLWTSALRSLSSTCRARRPLTGHRPLKLPPAPQAAQLSIRCTNGWTCSQGSGKGRSGSWRRLASWRATSSTGRTRWSRRCRVFWRAFRQRHKTPLQPQLVGQRLQHHQQSMLITLRMSSCPRHCNRKCLLVDVNSSSQRKGGFTPPSLFSLLLNFAVRMHIQQAAIRIPFRFQPSLFHPSIVVEALKLHWTVTELLN